MNNKGWTREGGGIRLTEGRAPAGSSEGEGSGAPPRPDVRAAVANAHRVLGGGRHRGTYLERGAAVAPRCTGRGAATERHQPDRRLAASRSDVGPVLRDG